MGDTAGTFRAIAMGVVSMAKVDWLIHTPFVPQSVPPTLLRTSERATHFVAGRLQPADPLKIIVSKGSCWGSCTKLTRAEIGRTARKSVPVRVEPCQRC